jgi:DNA-binding response OmpR family regulator
MIPLIVIIEDDKDLLTYLKDLLREHDFTTKTASTGVAGIELVENSEPSLVLLDLSLPDMSGEGVCMEIRKHHKELPIIMLTAKDGTTDKVRGLNAGADDYVTKPFIADELIARIKTRLRSTEGNESQLKVGDLVLDTQKIEVTRAGKPIVLTPQEFKLLEYLMRNVGVVLTREMVLNRIWLYSPDIESRVVDVYIGYLRKKIDTGHKIKLIHSIRGFGYTIKE